MIMFFFFPPSSQSDGVTLRLRRVAMGGEAYATLKNSIAHVESGAYTDIRGDTIGPSSNPDKVIVMVLRLDARPYRRTDTFTEVTVPAALLKAHKTKQGTWALIHVLEGRLVYKIVEPGCPSSNEVLTPTTPPGVVEPAVLHEVMPLGPVRFYVEFYRLDEAG